nr:hypothetical protein [Tanacetum cinerariifolium]
MHEAVHEMVVGECHEPNSEGSGSAWKAYMNVRVAGLFLLVLLEYPNGCRSSVRITMYEVVHEMVVGECHEPNSEGSGSAWKAYMNARVAGLFLLVLLEYPNGIDTAYETEYDVQSSEEAGSYDNDDDVDEYFLVDEENEIVEPNVDIYLFDAINADGFDSDPGNDEETNYRKRRLAELRTEKKGVINASGQWKYLFYTGQKFTTPKEAKYRVYLHFIKSRRNLKLCKNDGVRIRARCDGKVPVFTMSQGQVLVAVGLDLNNGIYPLAYALVKAESKSSWRWFLQCLGDDIDLHLNLHFTFISDRQKFSIMLD